MIFREIIRIDKEKCIGCGLCVSTCDEGIIQLIEGKAALIREEYCVGIGRCQYVCPTDAISTELRDIAEYNGGMAKVSVEENKIRLARLSQNPAQIQHISFDADIFKNADLVLAADCAAYASNNFSDERVENKVIIIGCPRIDKEDYSRELTAIINYNNIKSVTVVKVEVNCFGGIEHAVMNVLNDSNKFIVPRVVTISTDGRVIFERGDPGTSMFCYQCEQAANGTGCTANGICGKKTETSNLQDILTGELISLARTAELGSPDDKTWKIVIDGLFMTVTNVNFNDAVIQRQIEITSAEKTKLASICGGKTERYNMMKLWECNEDIRSLKSLLLFGMRGMAAFAHNAYTLGVINEDVFDFFYRGLSAVGSKKTPEEIFMMVMECGRMNLKCLEILDYANTKTYGDPVPVKVSVNILPGPFIVVSGHNLRDLKLLLEQSEREGVNVYTYGEMLPAHGYPEIGKYPHLKGNFGTAWQNQPKEFKEIPAPILFTSDCVSLIGETCSDKMFTTSMASLPGMTHIGPDKDFSLVIRKAKELGGYKELHKMTGINGGGTYTTGYAKATALSLTGKIAEAVKAGRIKHLFFVGGCDGVNSNRSYYTEFVKKTPADTVVFTFACGKFRFNDIDLGEVEGIPRLMDMGQCNDVYSALRTASALTEALNCNINELPVTFMLSWYEQKTISILLTLLAFCIKNIYIGPSLPAFISPNILSVLTDEFNLRPISCPEKDIKKILGYSNNTPLIDKK